MRAVTDGAAIEYAWTARDARGRRVDGRDRAAHELALDRQLEARGLVLIEARRAGRGAARGRGSMTREELVRWTAQLATTTGAGMPLAAGLATVGERLDSEPARALTADIVTRIEAGESLSAALARHPRAFPEVVVSSVRAGEESGALELVLERLSHHLEWQRGLRATTLQALIYPAVLMGAVGVLLVVLLAYVLPRIVGLYPAGYELPFETRAVLGASRFLTANTAVLATCAAALALAATWTWARPGGRRLAHAGLLVLPRLGRLAREIATSRFAATAGILKAAGCDALTMLDIAGQTCGNAAMAAGFARTGDRVRQGATIAQGLASERFADPLLVQMVNVGESSGELERCLTRVAAHYDQEVPRALKRMTALFEPGLLVVAGALVAFVLLAALLPIFELYGAVG